MKNKQAADQIYASVAKIPRGKVATYGQIAKISGVSPRYVGYLLHRNPDPEKIPCHRVINSQGQLAKNYAFGGERGQQERLKEEGVKVSKEKGRWAVSLRYNQ